MANAEAKVFYIRTRGRNGQDGLFSGSKYIFMPVVCNSMVPVQVNFNYILFFA